MQLQSAHNHAQMLASRVLSSLISRISPNLPLLAVLQVMGTSTTHSVLSTVDPTPNIMARTSAMAITRIH